MGPCFRPGAWIPEAGLRVAPGRDPIVIEQTEIEGPWNVARRVRRWEAMYIVWRYDGDRGTWEEAGRCSEERTQLGREVRTIAPTSWRPRRR